MANVRWPKPPTGPILVSVVALSCVGGDKSSGYELTGTGTSAHTPPGTPPGATVGTTSCVHGPPIATGGSAWHVLPDSGGSYAEPGTETGGSYGYVGTPAGTTTCDLGAPIPPPSAPLAPLPRPR